MARTNVVDDFQGLQAIRNHLKDTLPLYSAERTLTAAEILALAATPISVIPAPGSGLIAVPRLVFAALTAGDGPYIGNTAAEHLYLRWTDGSGAIAATIPGPGFLDSAVDAKRIVSAALGVAPVTNAAIVADLGEALELATGDEGGTIALRVYYNLIPEAFGL